MKCAWGTLQTVKHGDGQIRNWCILVAILDASLNFLECLRVTRWHQSVSLSRRDLLSKTVKTFCIYRHSRFTKITPAFCRTSGAPYWKTFKTLQCLRRQKFYEYLKNRLFRKVSADVENRTRRQAQTKYASFLDVDNKTTMLYPTEHVQPILQPGISTHLAHFRFEWKRLKFE